MREIPNSAVALLLVVFIVSSLVQVYINTVQVKIPKITTQATGLVKFCVDSNITIDSIGEQTAYVDYAYYYQVTVVKSENETAWFYDDTELFDINNQTGVIAFTPNQTQNGTYYINISVFSSCMNLKDYEVVKFNVVFKTHAPVLDPIPDFVINETEVFYYDVNATDPDNDTLTFGDDTDLFEINPNTGVIYFQPIQNDVGNHTVLIYVTDGLFVDFKEVEFTILDINNPPVLVTIGAQTAHVNETFYLKVNATDVDTVLPHNLTFYDNSTIFNITSGGVINFTPVDSQVNTTYAINISVTDSVLWDWEVISFTITTINHHPNITSWYPENETVEINEGESQKFNITKYDPDGTTPSTSWYFDTQYVGVTEDEYTYYASYTSAGTHNVTVVITDGELTDSHYWRLIIHDVPQPEEITGIGGGIGGGAALPVCTENWRCSLWPVCPKYGIQVRACWDLNNCGTTFNKPEETRPCVYVPEPSCSDGIKNCHHGSCEILPDCGGPCEPCPTCSDGIQNQNETDVDCGGPCPPCVNITKPVVEIKEFCGDGICTPKELFACPQDCGFLLTMYLITAVLLASLAALAYIKRVTISSWWRWLVYVFLVLLEKLFRKEYKPVLTRKQMLGVSTLRKLHKIQLEIGKKDVRELSIRFSDVMRGFFAGAFNIRYKFTYVELNEELAKRKVSKELVDKITEFSEKISKMEYSGHRVNRAELMKLTKLAINIVEVITGVEMQKALVEEIVREAFLKAEEKAKMKPEELKEKPVSEKEFTLLSKRLRKMITQAEQSLISGDVKKASEVYSRIREIYDTIPEEQKRRLHQETVRIIRLYNKIVKSLG